LFVKHNRFKNKIFEKFLFIEDNIFLLFYVFALAMNNH